MKLSDAWLRQIESDFGAIARVLDDQDATSYCQAIAKSQQVVEKALKVMDLVTQELYASVIVDDKGHFPRSAINRLKYLPGSLDQSLATAILRIMTGNEDDIRELCTLAPRYPSVGALFPKNTEYPFNSASGDWTSPADAFTLADVRRYKHAATRLRKAANRVASAAKRLPRP